MIANVNAKRWPASVIFAATWYCSRPPVPESPITMNLTESAAFGRVEGGAAGRTGCAAATETARQTVISSVRSRRTSVRGKDIGYVIHDDLRIRVEQDQMTAVKAVLQVVGEARKIQQQQRRHRRQRGVRRIGLVDRRPHGVRYFAEGGALVSRAAPGEIITNRLGNLRGHVRWHEVPRPRGGPCLFYSCCERCLARGQFDGARCRPQGLQPPHEAGAQRQVPFQPHLKILQRG